MVAILFLMIGYSVLACFTTLIASDTRIKGNVRKIVIGVLWPVWFVIVMHRYNKQKGKK